MVGPSVSVDALVKARGAVQRRAIAKAITLLESTRADHRAQQAEGDQELQQRTVEVAPEGREPQQVHQQQQRHQDRRGLRHRDRQRHQRHRERTEAGAEAALADAEQQHGGNGDRVEVRVGDEGEDHGQGGRAKKSPSSRRAPASERS